LPSIWSSAPCPALRELTVVDPGAGHGSVAAAYQRISVANVIQADSYPRNGDISFVDSLLLDSLRSLVTGLSTDFVCITSP
jgi:hypothetical protein